MISKKVHNGQGNKKWGLNKINQNYYKPVYLTKLPSLSLFYIYFLNFD